MPDNAANTTPSLVYNLGASITNVATSMWLSPSPTALPSPPFSGFMVEGANVEIMRVTAGSGTVGTPYTVTRGSEAVNGASTTYAFTTAAQFVHVLTAGLQNLFSTTAGVGHSHDGTTGNGPLLTRLGTPVGINTASPGESVELYNGNLKVNQGIIKVVVEGPPGAPTVALVADATGVLSIGAYKYRVTLVTPYGETAGGTQSSGVTTDASHKKVNLTAIPTGTANIVTARKIYRTAAGGTSYLLLTTISDNTTTAYTDNIADASLGAAPPLVNELALDLGTGTLTGGTNSATNTVKLDMSFDAGFPSAAFYFPANGGRFKAGEVGVAGTNDIFFQLLPATTSGYGYLEAWTSDGLVVGTGNNSNPIIFKINRVEVARMNSTGLGIGVTPTHALHLNTDDAAKPTTTTWTTTSDARMKEDVQPFTDGLETVRQLNPISFVYNGLGGVTAGLEGISILAQDAKDIIPYCVSTNRRKMHEDDAEDTDVYTFNPHALFFVLINAVKELAARVEQLEGRQ